jgi:hypothetical protein
MLATANSRKLHAELWKRLETFLYANYENPDIGAVKVMFAVVAAHRITDYPPAWLLVIAPSGSMKTEILRALEGLPSIHFVDEVTESTFISGKFDEPGKNKQSHPASLLHRIGKEGILVAADFSTYIAMDKKQQSKVLAQLRRIYDGQFSREFGTAENLNERMWKGRLTMLAGATPAIDRQYSIGQALGERFVKVRCPRAGGVQVGLRAISKPESVALELKQHVRAVLYPVLSCGATEVPRIPVEYLTRIAKLGEFGSLARAYVPRDRYTRKIDGLAAPEGNTRLPQQLAQIGRGWALIEGRGEINSSDYGLIRRAAWDCIPYDRRQVMEALLGGKPPYSTGLPPAVTDRALEDLEAVGLVSKDEQAVIIVKPEYRLSDTAKELLDDERISRNFYPDEERE